MVGGAGFFVDKLMAEVGSEVGDYGGQGVGVEFFEGFHGGVILLLEGYGNRQAWGWGGWGLGAGGWGPGLGYHGGHGSPGGVTGGLGPQDTPLPHESPGDP